MQTYSLSEVANILKVTRQALYLQKKKGKIKPIEIQGKQRFTLTEIGDYLGQRYSRDHYFTDGLISAQNAAEIAGTTLQRIYYLIYNNKLKAMRKNGMWFIDEKDIAQCDVFGRIRGTRAQRKIRRPVKIRVRLKRLKTLDCSKQRKKQD